MTLETLSYLLNDFYYSGRVKITNVTLKRKDFLQYARLGFAKVMRDLFLLFRNNKNTTNENYFYAKQLLYREFPLSDVTNRGFRRVDFGETTTIDLPENKDILYVYPVNGSCGNEVNVEEITLVQPGENVFYKDADYSYLQFAEKRGNGLDVYNVPFCVEKVEVEAVWDSTDKDIPNDISFDIVKYVLKDILYIKNYEVKSIDDFNSTVNANPQPTDQLP